MAKKNVAASKIDPELMRQVAAAAPDEKVSAVFTLRTPQGKPYLPADEARATVDQILHEQAAAVKSIDHVQVFANMQSFALDAPAAVIERLTKHPAVEAASADQQLSSPPAAVIPDETGAPSSKPKKSPKKKSSDRKAQ